MIAKKGRRDHYLPQGYMRGFIDPARENLPQPLWHLDIPHKRWSMRSTKQIGHGTGFYDYAGTAPELDSLQSADDAFMELENDFPRIRTKLLAKHYNRTVTLTSMQPAPPPAPFIKNRTITEMREEIQKGGSWLWDFNWALRYCDSVAEPFVTSEAPLVAEGPATEMTQALQHPETLLFFPLCWQACLIGSLQRFNLGTAKFSSEDMRTFRMKYRHFAQVFLISPTKLEDISDAV